jgi:asparagine synthase (glutamine-hydrolysing)
MSNLDPNTVASFGDEWSRFDQSGMADSEARKVFDEYLGQTRRRGSRLAIVVCPSLIFLPPGTSRWFLPLDWRYVIAFNGEIYNHLELRRDLENIPSPQPLSQGARGHISWRGHSDTETLLACFEAWGIEKTLASAVGMFAIALWDRETRTLTLARDRMGEKPLYYGWQGDSFLFGSELKALKAHPAFKADIDRGALALLLRHNYVPAPYSIYEGIYKLPAGTLFAD